MPLLRIIRSAKAKVTSRPLETGVSAPTTADGSVHVGRTADRPLRPLPGWPLPQARAAVAGACVLLTVSIVVGGAHAESRDRAASLVGSSCAHPYRMRVQYSTFEYAQRHKDPRYGTIYTRTKRTSNFHLRPEIIAYEDAYMPADTNPKTGVGPGFDDSTMPKKVMLQVTAIIDTRRFHFCGRMKQVPRGRVVRFRGVGRTRSGYSSQVMNIVYPRRHVRPTVVVLAARR